VQHMQDEFGECYPLHLGVTEAGDGEDGRIKSAIGIGTLLQESIGDTIRVSLTEDPEFEIPVCKDLVALNEGNKELTNKIVIQQPAKAIDAVVSNIGKCHVPIVIADYMQVEKISHTNLQSIGYTYNEATDKWNISDAAADFIYTGIKELDFNLPGTLKVIMDAIEWQQCKDKTKYFPLFQGIQFGDAIEKSNSLNFIAIDASCNNDAILAITQNDATVVYCVFSNQSNAVQQCKHFASLTNKPLIICVESNHITVDEQLIHFSQKAGALFLDNIGNGIWLMNDPAKLQNTQASGRTYLPVQNNHQFLNNTSFSILQATRKRISKTEYISCPSCGRTLFDLQETTAKIRAVTNHLKGLKIAIMGCIVNGPGEMADADFGYVGSGVGKITLYKGKEVVKKNIPSEVAVDELINLLKENEVWLEV
jgi:(E)-4-hydroxy-3-methylbut-2-enyl-diphosphate synthase